MITVERLIEEELFIQCPLVSSGDFIRFCKERDIDVSEDDLELYEKIGIFYPIARVEFPKYKEKIEYIENTNSYRALGILQEGEVWHGQIREDYGHFWWAQNIAREFCKEGLLWSPKDRTFTPWNIFYDKELMHRKIESYYSIFQIYPLYMIKKMSSMNLSLTWWSTYDNETINNLVAQIKDVATQTAQMLKGRDNISDEIANVCQIISNRYFPKTQSDRRTINISYPTHYHDWSWGAYCRNWDAKKEIIRMGIDEKKIKKYQEIMSSRSRYCDPLENWYDLVQFISLEKKKRLKGKSLLAQTFYAMELMLRSFYKNLTGQDLSEKEGINNKWKERVYGEGVPDSNMTFLEYLTNEFHLNPRPKLILIVEGKSEYEQIPRLAKEIGYSFDTLGIRIESVEGIGNFTSGKIERFIDHYHNLQTIVYIILDNEGNAITFREKILRKKSRYPGANRYITNEQYIFIWDLCFEFDNFSDGEIANALSSLSQGHSFSQDEIAALRKDFGKQKGATISTLYEEKTAHSLDKPALAELLVDTVIGNLDKEVIGGNWQRPLLKKVEEIIKLAAKNYQPHRYDTWKTNQESGYLGKKINNK
ncbi:MAG: hypothetical protein Q8M71_01015 [Thermodesulfovibrionales bacterium]|nr:hypothetical protein [Thermodesulfovibrionales bacterium]